jgi:hypothetical protein
MACAAGIRSIAFSEGIGKPAGNTSSGKTGGYLWSTILLTIQVTITSSVLRAHNRGRQVGVDANAGKAKVVEAGGGVPDERVLTAAGEDGWGRWQPLGTIPSSNSTG